MKTSAVKKSAPKHVSMKPAHRAVASVNGHTDKGKTTKTPPPAKAPEKTKGQSALANAVAEDELEERRRLFAKARKGDKSSIAKIYELYGARIYTPSQMKEVKLVGAINPGGPGRRRAH